jgi:hypothetical protein
MVLETKRHSPAGVSDREAARKAFRLDIPDSLSPRPYTR